MTDDYIVDYNRLKSEIRTGSFARRNFRKALHQITKTTSSLLFFVKYHMNAMCATWDHFFPHDGFHFEIYPEVWLDEHAIEYHLSQRR